MADPTRFEDLDAKERSAFCREFLERLSELVEEEAPEEFCSRVAELVGDCQGLAVFQQTLATTIELAGEAGDAGLSEPQIDEESFAKCIERARAQLAKR